MQYHSFTWIWDRIVFFYHSLKAIFFSFQGQRPFSTVTTVDDFIFHGIFRFPHRPRVWPLVWIAVTIRNSIPHLRIFTIRKVVGWQRSMMRPPQMRMQNGPPFIINCSSSRSSSGGVVFHKCSDIYKPPTPSILGDTKQILPLTGDTTALACTRIPNLSVMGGFGLGVCLLNTYAATRGQ